MINETLLYSAIISTVLGFGVFYVCWRYLQVPMYFLSDSYITTIGKTMPGSFSLGASDTLTIIGSNIGRIELSSSFCTTDHSQWYDGTVLDITEEDD